MTDKEFVEEGWNNIVNQEQMQAEILKNAALSSDLVYNIAKDIFIKMYKGEETTFDRGFIESKAIKSIKAAEIFIEEWEKHGK